MEQAKASSLSEAVAPSVDGDGFELCRREIDIGDFEACRRRLRMGEFEAPTRAWLYCRVGEDLFYREDRAAAAECAAAAFALQPDDESIVDVCAWLFSNCGRHGEAAAAYERLLDCRPRWAAGHRHASGSFAAVGELDRAVFHGVRAHEIEPDSFEFAFHAGCLLQTAGRY